MLAVDLIGEGSRASPASRCTSSSLTHCRLSPPFFLPSVCRVFFHLHAIPCTIQSPSGTPAWKASLCRNRINYQGQFSLQNKIFVAITLKIQNTLFHSRIIWHGTEERHSMIEKQLVATCSALWVVHPLTQSAQVVVKTIWPIQA